MTQKLLGSCMRTVNFSEARNNFKRVLDEVVEDVDVTIITRRDAEDAVVMSLTQYNRLMETVNLLQSPENAEEIESSIKEMLSGKTVQQYVFDE